MEISEVIASSRYRVRSALAETYYHLMGTGYILLAGDAAHVHSPIGGQGMNLGICDAVAAAQAISAHVKAVKTNDDDNGSGRRAEADEILQRYSKSRHTIGRKVVGMTQGMTRLLNLRAGWQKVVRNLLMRVILSLPFVRRAVAWKVSGLGNRD
jgi:2-polyprenyl-6-methoxyphenol hydroxylase-like FAD-dependent oxidoreductase